jgi:glycosyltransferase involved in cell wall biosynthesis
MKQTVCIFSGKSWEKWDYRNLEIGIGGSELWQIYLSREFDKLGFRVINFNDCTEDCKDGNIQYFHYTKFSEFVEYNWFDYFICSRTEDPFRLPIRAGKKFVMIHDVWMLSGKTVQYGDKIDKFACLSEWHKNFVAEYHNISSDKLVITSNGISFDRFSDIKVEKNPYRLHWSSSWDRGLDNVLYLWPFIKDQIPEAELHCYYGVFNWRQNCIANNDVNGLKKIEELEELVKQPGVFTYGRIGQKELAIEISKASLLLYPTSFEETFCITSIEAQISNVVVIASNYAGLKTTLKNSAILLGDGSKYWAYTKEGREEFLKETISILKDRKKWNEWADRGVENAKKYSWENCAKHWVSIFEQDNS